jgi:hypothetical protein
MAAHPGPLIVPPKSSGPAVASVTITNDIRGIKPPVPISNPWPWMWVLLAALVVAAAAYVAWRRMKRPQATATAIPLVPAHVRARQKLEAALRLIHDPRLFCIEVSGVLRVYLEERFDLRAPERTTDEFLFELRESKKLSPEQKESLRHFLESCDLVKFARFEPNESSLRELHEAALRLVEETRFEPVRPAAPETVVPTPTAATLA